MYISLSDSAWCFVFQSFCPAYTLHVSLACHYWICVPASCLCLHYMPCGPICACTICHVVLFVLALYAISYQCPNIGYWNIINILACFVYSCCIISCFPLPFITEYVYKKKKKKKKRLCWWPCIFSSSSDKYCKCRWKYLLFV